MSAQFKKGIGRLSLIVGDSGLAQHDYAHGCSLGIRDGWNDDCEINYNKLSVDELRDLRYLLDRAITTADAVVARAIRKGFK